MGKIFRVVHEKEKKQIKGEKQWDQWEGVEWNWGTLFLDHDK